MSTTEWLLFKSWNYSFSLINQGSGKRFLKISKWNDCLFKFWDFFWERQQWTQPHCLSPCRHQNTSEHRAPRINSAWTGCQGLAYSHSSRARVPCSYLITLVGIRVRGILEGFVYHSHKQSFCQTHSSHSLLWHIHDPFLAGPAACNLGPVSGENEVQIIHRADDLLVGWERPTYLSNFPHGGTGLFYSEHLNSSIYSIFHKLNHFWNLGQSKIGHSVHPLK